MSEARTTFDREIAARFREGPSRAPSGLLAAALDGSRHTKQRRGIVAALLGAPAAGPRVDVVVRGLSRREVVLIGLLISVLAGTLAVAGAMQLTNQQLVVVPSIEATPTLDTRPAPSAIASPAPAALFTTPTLGFALRREGPDPFTEHLDRWNGHDLGAPEWAVEFDFGTCPDGCGGHVSVSSSSPWYGVIVDWTSTDCPRNFSKIDCLVFQAQGGGPVRLRGASIDELAMAWIERFGPTVSTSRQIEGVDVRILQGDKATGALFVRGGGSYAVMVHATDGSSKAQQLDRLERFLDQLRFPDPAPAIYRDDDLGFVLSSLDIGSWTSLHQYFWGAGPGDDHSVAFWYGECIDNLCNKPYLSLSSGEPTTGAIVYEKPTGEFQRVRGSTLAKLRASWSQLFGASTFEDLSLGGRPAVLADDNAGHMAVLALIDGRVVSITVSPAAFGSLSQAQRAERLREVAEGGVYFPVDPSTTATEGPRST